MKKPKITEGGWRVNNYRPSNGQIVQELDPSTDNDARPGNRLICRCNENGNLEANARAIAAVPDLIDALMEARKGLITAHNLIGSSFIEDAWLQVEEALKKAGATDE